MVALLIVGAGCLVVLAVLVKAARLRSAIYRYDVRADQHYDFSRAGCIAHTAQITNGIVVLSTGPAGDVVFLEARIRSTLLGYWFEPFIEIASSHRRSRQPVERGGSGVRYFALSSLDFDGDSPLRLTGRHVDIPDQRVSFYGLKRNVDLDKEKILVLGTHPDDAEIAAFGVYADRDAYVVTLTAGEAGEPGPFAKFGGARAYFEKGRHRAWNSVAVPLLGGLSIHRTANLGYFDGTLRAMSEQPSVPVRSLHANAERLDVFGYSQDAGLVMPRFDRPASWVNLVADLEHLVKTLRPGIVITPYPRLDAHPDHQLSTAALLQALKNLNWQHGSLLLYANHLCSSDRFPFGDAGDSMSLPPGVDDIFFDGIVSNSLDATMQARKHMALDAMIDLRPQIEIDSLRSVAAAFKRALKAALTDGHGSADYFRQAVRANELFFEVRVSSLYEAGVIDKLLG